MAPRSKSSWSFWNRYHTYLSHQSILTWWTLWRQWESCNPKQKIYGHVQAIKCLTRRFKSCWTPRNEQRSANLQQWDTSRARSNGCNYYGIAKLVCDNRCHHKSCTYSKLSLLTTFDPDGKRWPNAIPENMVVGFRLPLVGKRKGRHPWRSRPKKPSSFSQKFPFPIPEGDFEHPWMI